jgi:hypothetical protein
MAISSGSTILAFSAVCYNIYMGDCLSIHQQVPSIKAPYTFQLLFIMASLHLNTSDNVDLSLGSLHHVEVGSVTDISMFIYCFHLQGWSRVSVHKYSMIRSPVVRLQEVVGEII